MLRLLHLTLKKYNVRSTWLVKRVYIKVKKKVKKDLGKKSKKKKKGGRGFLFLFLFLNFGIWVIMKILK